MTLREQEIDLRLIEVLTSTAALSPETAVPLTPDSLMESQCLTRLVGLGVIREARERHYYFDQSSVKTLEARDRARAFWISLVAMAVAVVIVMIVLLLFRSGG